MLAPGAAIQQSTLPQQLASDLPDVPLDGDRISQVLMDLLTNALKFTPIGGNILVTTTRPSPDKVQVAVIDSGCGMNAHECQHLFENSQKKNEVGGTVTGLHVAREHVRQHGGDLWVQSEPNRGSTFTFSLPVKNAAAKAAPTLAPEPQPAPTSHTAMLRAEIDA